MARFVPYMSNRRNAWFEPTQETINAIEGLISWAEAEVPTQLRYWMNELAFHMALVNQGYARKMSFGPLDPSQKRSDLAWKIPVRRISERYYLGWKVRQISADTVQLYNDSREAYFIEFGINWLGKGRLVRRPIRKLSLLKTLEHMATTNAYHRVWANVFKHHGKGYGFTQTVQSPGMGSFEGPQLGRRLP